ncbi:MULTISPECIES: hypothetical protein [unclassified Nocardioides]|uniref:hypothetical protein n=1 Tax=unclassified Nocardioides TaxID=2615069 RepID=UPI0036193BCE
MPMLQQSAQRISVLAAVVVTAVIAGTVHLASTNHGGGDSPQCGAIRLRAGTDGIAAAQDRAVTELIVKFRAGSPAGASTTSRECVLDVAGGPLGLSFDEQRTLGTGATLWAADRSLDAAEVRQLIDRLERHADVEYAAPNETAYPATGG